MKKVHAYQKSKYLSNNIIKYLIQKASEFESQHFHHVGRFYREKAKMINHQVKETT
ncbi:MAG: hypothetical protein KFF73_09700 [Cyclobacteriaceae bacterium]|nr:hypothetical protein [Cyclobacteriaceae bacterium]